MTSWEIKARKLLREFYQAQQEKDLSKRAYRIMEAKEGLNTHYLAGLNSCPELRIVRTTRNQPACVKVIN